MKAIRRSLKGEKEPKPHHVSVTPKSAIAILPPKKVIKAIYDYTPASGTTQVLAFNKGDFFHVISRENDPDWYEACNPLIPSARGLVPVQFFEVVGKTERQSGGSGGVVLEGNRAEPHDSVLSERGGVQEATTNTTKQGARARMSGINRNSGAMVYGVVLYDFQAERPDELEAKAGEAIIVIAQSNPEWFVAKPIGRLGGPGLIPVSFIEIRDMTTGQAVTDPLDAVRRAGVPRVEEWKKMTAEYKNSSITLGKLEAGSPTLEMERMSLNNGNNNYSYHQRSQSRNQYQSQQYNQPPQQQQRSPAYLLAPIAASIPRYCFENDKYWYIIEAKMEDGSYWELARYYHDFYDFQIALLTQFEEEAGNKGKPRTLPFMPGPVTHVTDAISNGRRQNLDDYIKKLLAMPPHISRCQLVRQLFSPRPGDYEIDPNAVSDDFRLSGGSQQSSGLDQSGTISRESSRGQISGYQSAGGGGAMGPPSQRPTHQRSNGSVGQSNGGSQSPASRTDMQGPMMNRQTSSLTQASTMSGAGAIRIKVNFGNDLIVIRVPADITYTQLKEKLKDRLKLNSEILVRYRDEPSNGFVELFSDNDLDIALQRNQKLALYVGLV